MPIVKEPEHVIAIAAHRLMVFLRLALVAALAAYMLPTVSFAMHGDAAATYAPRAVQADDHAAHSHHGMGVDAAHDHGDQAADHHKNTSKQDCCSSFCLNMAVVGDAPQFRAIKESPTRAHTNDLRVFAEPIRLHRPPAFRA